MHGFIIVTVIYLLSKMNMHGMDSTSMAKQALGHLQFMVNGLRSTSSTAPDKNMNFYGEVLKDAPPNVAAWYQLCLKYKKKKVIERIYGLHFEGAKGIKNLKAAIHLKANGIGHKIPTQQDLVKRTLEDPAFKDLSFWPPSESPPVTPEPMVVAPEASSEPPTIAEEASVPPPTTFNHPSTAPEPPALTTITAPVEMEIDKQGKISNIYYCKFCIIAKMNILLLRYILNLEIADEREQEKTREESAVIALDTIVVAAVQVHTGMTCILLLYYNIINIYYYSFFIKTQCSILLFPHIFTIVVVDDTPMDVVQSTVIRCCEGVIDNNASKNDKIKQENRNRDIQN
jgi:hypothetical protein